MRKCIVALCISVVLLGTSSVFPAKVSQDAASTAKPEKREASVYAELTKAPEKVRTKRNPLENDSDAVAAGRNLFQQHCAECHGEAASGGKKGPNLRVEEVQNAPPGTLFWILTNGVVRRGMPVWSKLPEPQRWQLVSFLKSLGVSPPNSVQKQPPSTPGTVQQSRGGVGNSR